MIKHLLILIFYTPGALVDYTVCERVTVSWGGGGSLVWTGGGGALRMMNDDFYAAIRDISFVMKKRAQTDYGLKVGKTIYSNIHETMFTCEHANMNIKPIVIRMFNVRMHRELCVLL